MISPHPFRAADTESLSALRSGNRLIGVRMMREIVRASDHAGLLAHARRALDDVIDAVSAVARDDAHTGDRREKAAEFIVRLRSRQTPDRTIEETVNRVAEAASLARYRSGRIVDFLSTWLFVAGERFIAQLGDPVTAIELELAHPGIWSQVRTSLLEILEGGAERMKAGRRFRLSEYYLAKFRLVRARNEERTRAARMEQAAVSSRSTGTSVGPDYVASMIVDLFVLSLSELQQRLVVSQIPNSADARATSPSAQEDHRRIWVPIRAVRTDQAFSRWKKLRGELDLPERQTAIELLNGMSNHLRRTWNWFFPDRLPYGPVRSTLEELEDARLDESPPELEEELIDRLFGRYREAIAFLARLATEDCASAVLDLDEDSGGGVL